MKIYTFKTMPSDYERSEAQSLPAVAYRSLDALKEGLRAECGRLICSDQGQTAERRRHLRKEFAYIGDQLTEASSDSMYEVLGFGIIVVVSSMWLED